MTIFSTSVKTKVTIQGTIKNAEANKISILDNKKEVAVTYVVKDATNCKFKEAVQFKYESQKGEIISPIL